MVIRESTEKHTFPGWNRADMYVGQQVKSAFLQTRLIYINRHEKRMREWRLINNGNSNNPNLPCRQTYNF